MGLGPPSCDDCRVWLNLDPSDGGRGWYCPVCEKNSKNGYTHLRYGHSKPRHDVYDSSLVPFLRFMKGKEPNVVD